MISKTALVLTLSLLFSISLPTSSVPSSPRSIPRISPQSITPASSSTLIINTTGASFTSGVIDSKSGYAYFATSDRAGRIFKIRLSDFTNVANLSFAPGESAALAATLDSSDMIAYFGTPNSQIVAVNLTSFRETASVTLHGVGGMTSAAIVPGTGFAYFGTNTGNILRIRLSDLSVNKTLSLNNTNPIQSIVIDPVAGYAYAAAASCGINIFQTPPPNVIAKVNLAYLTLVAELDPGVGCLTSAGIDPTGGYVYFDSNTLAVSHIIRISTRNFSMRVLATEPEGGDGGFVIDPTRGLGYSLVGSFVALFRLSDFNQIGTEYLQNYVFNVRIGVLDPATGYTYFGTTTFQTPFGQTGAILRISPSTLPSNDFSLEASPSQISFQEGGVGAEQVSVQSNNFTGTISLTTSVSSSYALQPTTQILQPTLTIVLNGDNSSVIALSAPIQDDVPASTFIIIITGSSGPITRSISFETTVTPGPTDFVPIINPPSLAMNRYANYSSIALVTHTGFSGTFNFTSKITPNIPHGPTANVSPASATISLPKETYTDVSWVFVSANSSTTLGEYQVDVTATSGNIAHTAQLCLIVLPQGVIKFCLLSNPNSLTLGPGQTGATLITQYMPHPPFNATFYLRTVSFTASVVTGPSTIGLHATLNPSVFPLPYILPGPQQLETTLSVTASPNAPPGDYILRVSSSNGTITGAVDIPVTISAALVSATPGVFPGDWVHYQVSASWSSTSLGIPPISEIAPYMGSYEATVKIGSTVGNETAGLLSTAFLNGTANIQEITGNTNVESGTLFPWIVGSDLVFNRTTTEEFAEATRQVSIFSVTRTNGIATVTGNWTWDLQTGILLDYQLTVQATGNLGTINGQLHVGMIETNLWTPTLPSFMFKQEDSFLTMKQNTMTNIDIGLTSLNGFTGSVSLRAQPLPSNPDIRLAINNAISLGPENTVNATLMIRASDLGRFIILLNASSSGQLRYALVEVTVIAVPPVVTITSVSPNPANTGDTVTVDFTVNTAKQVSSIAVDWGDGTVSHPDITASSDTHVYQTSEYDPSHTFTINVTATNIAGTGFATISEVVNDRPPVLAIISLSPRTPYQGQTITLNFTATDPDGIVSATWVDWGDGSISDLLLNMTSASMCPGLNQNLNNNACTIAPGDLILAQSQDPSTIINESIVVFTPNPAYPNLLVVHRIIGIVPPSLSVYGQYSFKTQGDANPVPDCFDQYCYIPAIWIVAVYRHTLTPTKTVAGERYDPHTYPGLGDSSSKTYNIRINATDNNGAHSYLTTTATINDRPPTTTITSPISSGTTTTGATFTLIFSATDPDGTIRCININWGDGTTSTLAGRATSSPHVYNSSGTFTITITATDNSGSTSQPSTKTVTVNPLQSPAEPAQTILGLAPILFYGLIAAVIVLVLTATVTVLTSRRKTR